MSNTLTTSKSSNPIHHNVVRACNERWNSGTCKRCSICVRCSGDFASMLVASIATTGLPISTELGKSRPSSLLADFRYSRSSKDSFQLHFMSGGASLREPETFSKGISLYDEMFLLHSLVIDEHADDTCASWEMLK